MLDVSNEGMGSVMELLGNRAAIVQSVDPIADRVRITAEIPARQLIGLRSRMLTATEATILQHSFLRWDDAREDIKAGSMGSWLPASQEGDFPRGRATLPAGHFVPRAWGRGV